MDSLAAILTRFAKRQMFIHIFGTVANCHAIRICRIATKRKQGQEPTQLTPWQLFGLANRTAKSWNFKRDRNFERKKSGQRSAIAIDEEAFVAFCLCCLIHFASGGRLLEHSKINDGTRCVLLRGMCHVR